MQVSSATDENRKRETNGEEMPQERVTNITALLILLLPGLFLQTSDSQGNVPNSGALLPKMSFDEVETASLDYRREHFKRGKVLLKVANRSPNERRTTYLIEIDFDGESLRKLQTGGLEGRSSVFDQSVIANEQYIRDSRSRTDTPVVVAAKSSYENPREMAGAFHPRSLGMSTTGIQHLTKRDVETLLNRSDHSDKQVSQDIIDGRSVYRLDSRSKSGATLSVWISPEQGFGVIKARSEGEHDGQELIQETRSELAVYPLGDIWYPKQSTYVFTIDGQEVDRQEVDVEEAVFGRAPDPKSFTLEGLQLEPGRVIIDQTRDYLGSLYWDGEKVISDVDLPAASTQTESDGTSLWRQLLLLFNALLCAVLACFLVRRWWYQKA